MPDPSQPAENPPASGQEPPLQDPSLAAKAADDQRLGDQMMAARDFLAAIPHARALAMRLDALGGGEAVISMPYDARLVGDPHSGVIHGGAVSALMDTCSGAAVMSHPESAGATATIDLRIDYMRAARPGQRITARASCHHVTRSVAFVRATAHDEEGGLPVAMATGAFTFQSRRREER